MRYGIDHPNNSFNDRLAFPAQSSVLDEAVLGERVVSQYRIQAVRSCRFLTRGDSDIYRVDTEGPSYYLKIYRPPHAPERVEAEARLVAALDKAGVPVVRPVARHDALFASQAQASEGVRPMLLFEEAPPPLPAINSVLCRAIGEAIARLHQSVDNILGVYALPTAEASSLRAEKLVYLQEFISKSDSEYIEGLTATLEVELEKWPKAAPHFGLCHADLVFSNMRSGEGKITLFDFGAASYTWRAYEFAIVQRSLVGRAREESEILWGALLDGYSMVRELPEGLEEQLPLMRLLDHVSWLASNCATLPLRLGTEPFEGDFLPNGLAEARRLAERCGL